MDFGIESTSVFVSVGVMRTGATGDLAGGRSFNGCVSFICAEPRDSGGSDKTLMRAISFFGPGK